MSFELSAEALESIGHLETRICERLGKQETLEDGVGGEGEDGHEHMSHHTSDETTHNCGRDRGRHGIGIGALGEDGEAVEGVEATDEEDSENTVDRSDSSDSSEASGVHQD